VIIPLFISKLFIVVPRDLLIDIKSSINTDIMNFLSIDCSTDLGSLFIKVENKTFNKILQSDKYSNDLLMKQILDFFTENNLSFNDISEILVNQGPGNFSALRSSLAIVKGISLAKNLKLFGYNTFLWSCIKFFNKHDTIYSLTKYKEKYFVKKFDKNLISNTKAEEITKEEITKKYNNNFKVITKNVAKYFDDEILKLNNLNIVDLDCNDLEFLRLRDLLEKDLIKPIYLS
jgi:tRNA threonylcarbamoyl adenosine modification protein YeaZ